MKKLIISGAILSLFAAAPAFAQDTHPQPIGIDDGPSIGTPAPIGIDDGPSITAPQKKNPIRIIVETKKAEIKDVQEKLRATAKKPEDKKQEDRHEDKKVELKDDKGGLRHDIAKMRATVATKVFDATIARFEKLIERIQSRIDKIKADNGDTSAAQAALDLAKTNIVGAKSHIVTMQSFDISSTTATTTLRANFEKIKTEAKTARELLTSAKQNLMKSLQALKQWEAKNHKSATSTEETH